MQHYWMLDTKKMNIYHTYYGAKNIDINRGNLIENSFKFPVNNEHNIV